MNVILTPPPATMVADVKLWIQDISVTVDLDLLVSFST